EKKNISATTYFWVVPVVPVSITLGAFLLFILLLAWFIRRYIRRALTLERERYGIAPTAQMPKMPIFETMMEPLKEGVVDLRKVTGQAQTQSLSAPASQAASGMHQSQGSLTVRQFFNKYRLFFIFVLVLFVCI